MVWNVNHSSLKFYFHVEDLLESQINSENTYKNYEKYYKECCSAKPVSFLLFWQSLENWHISSTQGWFKKQTIKKAYYFVA